MAEEVDINIIKKTQDSLGKIIQKPILAEKLLKKPPFRFLHDIITSVISTTGFMKDVFTTEQLKSENFKEKDAKLTFLQKAIDEVGSAAGVKLAVRPAKVIAGHEADKTNIFLQALAKAAKGDAVAKNGTASVKTKDIPSKRSESLSRDKKKSDSLVDRKKSDTKKTTDKIDSKAKTRSRSHEKPPVKKDKSSKEVKKSVSSTKDPKVKPSSKDRAERSRESHRSKNSTRNVVEKDKKEESTDNVGAIPTEAPPMDSPKHKAIEIENGDGINKDITDHGLETEMVNNENGIAAKEIGDGVVDGGDGDTNASVTPRQIRPATSRTVPLRPFSTRPSTSTIRKIQLIKANHAIMSPSHTANTEEPFVRPPTSLNRLRSARPASARPPPPVLKSKRAAAEETTITENVQPVANLIVENEKDNEEEDNAFVIEEQTAPLENEVEAKSQVVGKTDIDLEGQHGSLVAQILETKKDLETGSQDMSKTEIDKSMMSDVTRRKERDVIVREVDKMRSSIQSLTRSINPLGKMIDYLQEDVDSMHKELSTWQKENIQHSQALKREQIGINNSSDPLKMQLDEVEQAIQDQLEKIGHVKANILRNEEKIVKLLTSSTRS